MNAIHKVLATISGANWGDEREDERALGALLILIHGGDVAGVRRLLRDEQNAFQATVIRARALSFATPKDQRDVVETFVDAGWSVDEATEDGLTALSVAVARGSAELVLFLLGLGASVNTEDKLGNRPLTWVAGFLDWRIIEILKEANPFVTRREAALLGDNNALRRVFDSAAELDVADKTGFTLLQMAVANAHPQTVRMLLEMGCDVNLSVQDRTSDLPICLAVRGLPYGCRFADFFGWERRALRDSWPERQLPALGVYYDILKDLIKHGAAQLGSALQKAIDLDNPVVLDLLTPNTLPNSCHTPLTYAIDFKRSACVRRLIELREDVNGTPPDPRCRTGRLGNPVNAAVWNLVQTLPSSRIRQFGETGWEASGYSMWIAGDWPDKHWHTRVFDPRLHQESMAILESLLDAGADPDAPGAMVSAAERGHSGAVEVLLQHGATAHAGEAVLFGSMDMLNASIERGDDIELSTWNVHTPLILAAEVANIEAVRLLLDSGANVNAATDDGWTALMFATQAGNVDIVRLLLSRGPRIGAVRKGGETPVSLGKASGNREILNELKHAMRTQRRGIST